MFKGICTSVFMLSIVLIANLAVADTINIDMVPTGGGPAYSGTAAASDTGTYWNAYSQGNWMGGSATNLLASDGSTATGVSLSSTSDITVALSMRSTGAGSLLLDDGASVNGTSSHTQAIFTLAGLTANQKYDLYLYGTIGTDSLQGTKFTIDGESRVTGGNNDTSFVEGGLASAPVVTGSNYVHFQNVTAVGSQIVIGVTDGGLEWGGFNGLQVMESVPEPCTLIMLATGLVGLLAYAWRKRK
jgi:hypothetical protein